MPNPIQNNPIQNNPIQNNPIQNNPIQNYPIQNNPIQNHDNVNNMAALPIQNNVNNIRLQVGQFTMISSFLFIIFCPLLITLLIMSMNQV